MLPAQTIRTAEEPGNTETEAESRRARNGINDTPNIPSIPSFLSGGLLVDRAVDQEVECA